MQTNLNKTVYVDHQSLGPADDKLIHTCDGMGPSKNQNQNRHKY